MSSLDKSCELVVPVFICFFFFKQKTAYEMRISDWSSDVCSSDLPRGIYERPHKRVDPVALSIRPSREIYEEIVRRAKQSSRPLTVQVEFDLRQYYARD